MHNTTEKLVQINPRVSLNRQGNQLASAAYQLEVLNHATDRVRNIPKFAHKMREAGVGRLRAANLEILQLNVGKMCNQVCKHCHVDAGPDRTEIMTRETLASCLKVAVENPFHTVDITGGAPEMNPDFRWFVAELRASRPDMKIIVRSNLTIILANKSYNDLPSFFAQHNLTVVSSLPYYQKRSTDRQRGDGVFESSIQALQLLNQAGFARVGSGLILDLVYNPAGAFLPAPQAELELDFKRELRRQFGIEFNSLYTITNLPISRFLEFLLESGNLEEYLEKLVQSFNPSAALGVMCRSTLSVGWDGALYDCDFNQMLEMPVIDKAPRWIGGFDWSALCGRQIAVNQHCYGCTAGAGSSCGGAIVEN